MKVLQVIESAYRATIEEQDDPALWITQAMRGAGGEFAILLRGNAVNYVCRGQNAGGLAFGEWSQTQAPDISADLTRLIAANVEVYVIQEDVEQRGLPSANVREDVEVIRRRALPDFLERFDQIWQW